MLGPAGVRGYHDVTVIKVNGKIVDYTWGYSERTVTVDGEAKVESTWSYISGDTRTVVHDPGVTPAASAVWPQAGANPSATFEVISGRELGVWERVIGESLEPFLIKPDSAAGAKAAMTELLTKIDTGLDLYAVRLAVQGGPLAQYFSTIHYDAAGNIFQANGSDQLGGVYAALLGDAAHHGDPVAWLQTWCQHPTPGARPPTSHRRRRSIRCASPLTVPPSRSMAAPPRLPQAWP
ncbi:hypothetical protein WCLP8_4830007 [uncultured Gammaproteobacteria bacterium]